MNTNTMPNEKLMFNAMLLFYVVHANQIGVGILGLPRILLLEAGHDAWISVLLTTVGVGIDILIIITILKQFSNLDLYDIHTIVFGKWVGKLFNFLFVLYSLGVFFIILINYIEIVQVWVFPEMKTWFLTILLLILASYGTLGGVRMIVGIAFVSIVFTFWIFFVLITPFRYIDFTHYFPIMAATPKELLMGAYKTSFSIFGFEILFLFWPYIKEKQKAIKISLLANMVTILLLAFVTFVSIGFFAKEGLGNSIWPLLSMFKIVRIPNLERFEIIAISFWMLVILPNLCFYLWSATKGLKKILKISQRKNIWATCIILWLSTFLINSTVSIRKISDLVSAIGFYIVFVYPLFLLIIIFVRKKAFKKGLS
ncbi:GerAB/ArcD/ProY family transporter [Cytobacillus massiliigabonensis]|uniref:GerAB/ArcD/ProY family transporter n=1 Tax=Cytobacillus massiliigabonensis TaxID=1871011 RepID=UPI0015E062B0|nr:GerAB/ArcD/ProY family transporter [Cytobacillus massiliigabonensis]